MGSRAILTVTAATAAALGGGTAPAVAAAATTAPKAGTATAHGTPGTPAVPVTAAAPAMPLTTPLILPLTGVVGAENAMDIGNGMCVAPLRLSGSLTQVLSAPGQGCGRPARSGGGGGV